MSASCNSAYSFASTLKDRLGATKRTLLRLLLYIRLYGLRRVYFKSAGRLRLSCLRGTFAKTNDPAVGIIGCGQFAFSTIGYYLTRHGLSPFIACFDTDIKAKQTFASFFSVTEQCESADDLINNPLVKYIYIASPHSTHADYAVRCIRAGKTVYCEKPIAVSYQQLQDIQAASVDSQAKIYFGYNRPFSPFTKILRTKIHQLSSNSAPSPMTLSCFISGHEIPSDHWYRLPDEGSRISGNLGHWIDFVFHLFGVRGLPQTFDVSITYSPHSAYDDNLVVVISTNVGDICSLVLGSRSEPFEGITERICVLMNGLRIFIDDFVTMTLSDSQSSRQISLRRKSVGHKSCILQPFSRGNSFVREPSEVFASTMLTLYISDMVKQGLCNKTVRLSDLMSPDYNSVIL